MSKYVFMTGSDLSVKGGMTTIINIYKDQGLFDNTSYFVPSHISGSIVRRLIFFTIFLIKYIFYLLFQRSIKIVHVHTSYKGSFFRKAVVMHIARIFGKKTIYHLNGSEFNVFYEKSPTLIKKYIQHTLNNTDLILVVSEQWKKSILEKNITSRIEVLYNPTLLKEMVQNDSQDTNVLFMGKIGKRKGAYDVLEAAKLIDMPEVKIYMYGDGETEILKNLVEKSNLQEKLIINGWIEKEDIDKAYKNADIYILPSYNEGLPLSILEATSYGLPVISTNIGGIPEAVVDGLNGYILEPGDFNSLAEKIMLLARDKELRIRMGTESLKLAKEKFEAGIILKQLNEFYRELV